MNKVLTEVYRPKSLDDIVGNEEIIKCLKSFENLDATTSNMLFYGPPGVGKTTAIKCLLKRNYLELNASDDRGIQIVRENIKEYASINSFNFIILDEVDSMSRDAQGALRRIMEDFSDRARFILICNYLNKIIDPIKSRCTKFRFKKVSDTSYLKKICEKENIEYEELALKIISESSNGDMRRVINTLSGVSSSYKVINEVNTCKFLNILNSNQIDLIYNKLTNEDVKYNEVLNYFIENEIELSNVINQLAEKIVKSDSIDPSKVIKIAQIEERLLVNCNNSLQLKAFIKLFK